MHRLFVLFNKYKSLLYLFLLQGVSIWLIVANNRYQNVYAFNTSNAVIAQTLEYRNQLNTYLNYGSENKRLAQENADLRKIIAQGKIPADSSYTSKTDSAYRHRYKFIVAKVVNNSTTESKNYITINKGKADHVDVDMGIIGPNGIVGKVKSCSEHFSTVFSMLHSNMSISAKLKKSNTEGTIQWDGADARYVTLKNIPRHIKLVAKDTVLTSSYSDIYPEGLMIGTVVDYKVKGDEAFYRIRVKLSTDFNNLGYVYIVNNKVRIEKDSLETLNKED
ncbi:MAG: rod shape-determining protein MreC [Cytophagales bacterium]